jgi:hypothetical protein
MTRTGATITPSGRIERASVWDAEADWFEVASADRTEA